jgi:ribosomal-protein-alanine N-acetyltransferase
VQDAAACAELERVLFPGDDPWDAQAFRDELAAGNHYLAARTPDGLVGYGGLALLGRPPQTEAEIHTIGVHPDHQGHGLGRRLLQALLERADETDACVFLEVRTDNRTAIGLYKSAGFAVIDTRRRYYRPSGADAFTMRRPPRSALRAGRESA